MPLSSISHAPSPAAITSGSSRSHSACCVKGCQSRVRSSSATRERTRDIGADSVRNADVPVLTLRDAGGVKALQAHARSRDARWTTFVRINKLGVHP